MPPSTSQSTPFPTDGSMSGAESHRENTFSAPAAERVKEVTRPCRFWYALFIMFQNSWNVTSRPTLILPSITSRPP
jgi:hypothetical protein